MPTAQEGSNKLPWVIVFFFFILYSLISLVNHWMYRTFALDLGMFNQAVYAYAHGKSATFTLDTAGRETPFLATHFSPITILYAPFYYLFGSYALLIIQIVVILGGGIGIFKIAALSLQGNNRALPILLLLQFFFCWGIFSALSFDFHNNVVGAMLLPWLMYYYRLRKKAGVVLFTILILATQETMALWLIFIFTGLMIEHRNKISFKAMLRFELPLAFICAIYAWIVLSIVMPALQGSNNNLQLSRYVHLGKSFSDIIIYLATHPIAAFEMMFCNTLHDPLFDGIKAELYIVALFSGGVFLLFRPVYLLMLVPVLAQKMLSNDYGFWGINGQYSIELIPVISIAFISVVSKAGRKKLLLAIIVLCSTVLATFTVLDHRKSKWYLPANNRFYHKDHFQAGLDIGATNQALKDIPAGIPVSSCSRLASHMANRSKLYHFPIVKDATYIVLEKAGNHPFPLEKKAYLNAVEAYKNAPGWITQFENKDILILKRYDR